MNDDYEFPEPPRGFKYWQQEVLRTPKYFGFSPGTPDALKLETIAAALTKQLGMTVCVDPACPPDAMYIIPKISGLCLQDDKLKVAFTGHNGEIEFRELTDEEKRRFFALKNIGKPDDNA